MPYKDIAKRREAHKRYYNSHLSLYREKNLRRKKMLLDFVNKLKVKPCLDCKVVYPPYVMDFDHRDGDLKLNSIAKLARNGWSTKRLLTEIEKCDLVCANCHRIRSYNRLTKI